METRLYQNENLSLLGMGCMRLPTDANGEIDKQAAQAIIDRAYAAGVNYYDTAYNYHAEKSELFIGEALKKYPRESYHLATKMPGWRIVEKGGPEAIFNEQLNKCGVDYFDFYLLHAVSRNGYHDYVDSGAIAFLEEMKRQGKIRHLGFSYHDKADFLKELVVQRAWDFVQIQLNYMDWEMHDAADLYAVLEQAGLPVIIMEPVRGGALADLSPDANAVLKTLRPQDSIASWAIRFAASLPKVITVLSGMTTLAQLEDNLKTMSPFEPYSSQEHTAIQEAMRIFREEVTIPCTGCRYCICPSKVDIPKLFHVHNKFAVEKNAGALKRGYAEIEDDRRAKNCIACGSCKTLCPQKIDIPAHMEALTEVERKYLL